MKNFDQLLDGFISEGTARGIGETTLLNRRRELTRWGDFLKNRRPRVYLETLNPELINIFLKNRSHFRSKATIAGTMSHLRCFGDYLNREGVWKRNHIKATMGYLIEALRELKQRAKNNKLEFITKATYVDYLPYIYFGKTSRLLDRTATPKSNKYVQSMKIYMTWVRLHEILVSN